MPDDFDLDAALDRLDTSTRTLVRVRPAEEIRTRGDRRHVRRVGALSAAAALVAAVVVAGYLGTGSGSHRSAPPASTATPGPTVLRSVSDDALLAVAELPGLQGGTWTGGATHDEAAISDPAHSCQNSTLSALGALQARQRDWAYVTPAGSGMRYRQVVGSYASAAEAEQAAGALLTVLDSCTPRGLRNPHVGVIDTAISVQDAQGVAVATADVYGISGSVSGGEGRFEYVAVGRRANAVVLTVLTQVGGQDSNLEQSVYTRPVTAALDRLAPYDSLAGPA